MLVTEEKQKAVEFITNQLGKLNVEHQLNKLGEIIDCLKDRDFPVDVASDLVYLKIDLQNESDFIIYSLLEAIDVTLGTASFFAFCSNDFEFDSSGFNEQRYQVKKFSFPLKFKMVQINNSMWIGAVSAKELMELRDAQLIYYNENTQRKLRHVVDSRSNIEYYTIDIKQSSVDSIKDLMLKGIYIPDALVFNIPEDTDYTYDAKNCQLVIKALDHFDIIDGYHRYRAISNLCQIDKDFDYVMQLQIVCYSESKAQQFMWQKDQQTKLKKLDSATLNQENAGTRIAQRLNEDPSCDLYGKITRNSTEVNSIELANIIQCIFFSNSRAKQDVSVINGVTKEIKKMLNIFYEHYDGKFEFLVLVDAVFSAYCKYTNQSRCYQSVLELDDIGYLEKTRVMRKVDATRIAKAMGVKLNV